MASYQLQPGSDAQRTSPILDQAFQQNFQAALLLALREKGLLTQCQLEQCMDQIAANAHRNIG
ncbi:hypothetical protein FACS1894191_8190 [Clostridia bacterium]|nr:hypothetical protein FACS1894191_8190 [Clostridia bacterium]